jgi:glycosyltransferase involved in cell wall biosynthesis
MEEIKKNTLIIVVPCFNESQRIPTNEFISFLKKDNHTKIVFSDDGSTDNTIQVLKEIQNSNKDKVFIVSSNQNQGKAEAVREGVLFCFRNDLDFDSIAYLDADLSTSLEECLFISNEINENILFSFGSRILKIDTNIERKLFRHLTGRIIATIISEMLRITVYDTQCGCKVFKQSLAKEVFREKFISKWLFDVEIFYRIIHLYDRVKIQNISKEIPLKSWIAGAESKVKITYFFRMWFDLFFIYRKYNGKKN